MSVSVNGSVCLFPVIWINLSYLYSYNLAQFLAATPQYLARGVWGIPSSRFLVCEVQGFYFLQFVCINDNVYRTIQAKIMVENRQKYAMIRHNSNRQRFALNWWCLTPPRKYMERDGLRLQPLQKKRTTWKTVYKCNFLNVSEIYLLWLLLCCINPR